ncbi:hypothetical protein OsJ_03700 [Oryza sativa Japonica Group]|uniref:Uncharacterized protein n=1 Tax=Oryza sativa subsp. japonica TaxID=39947 RepID=A2ZYH8_ORYSJ|nr:hypothetical protein OsJ_03700 [Oryza sativa Japonica Group]
MVVGAPAFALLFAASLAGVANGDIPSLAADPAAAASPRSPPTSLLASLCGALSSLSLPPTISIVTVGSEVLESGDAPSRPSAAAVEPAPSRRTAPVAGLAAPPHPSWSPRPRRGSRLRRRARAPRPRRRGAHHRAPPPPHRGGVSSRTQQRLWSADEDATARGRDGLGRGAAGVRGVDDADTRAAGPGRRRLVVPPPVPSPRRRVDDGTALLTAGVEPPPRPRRGATTAFSSTGADVSAESSQRRRQLPPHPAPDRLLPSAPSMVLPGRRPTHAAAIGHRLRRRADRLRRAKHQAPPCPAVAACVHSRVGERGKEREEETGRKGNRDIFSTWAHMSELPNG